MSPAQYACALCGHQFDVSGHVACKSCALHGSCEMICCPNCGYNTVELSGSRMAHVAAWLFSSAGLLRKSSGGVLAETEIESRPDGVCTLAEVKPGSHARVVGFSQLTPVRCEQLRAYGLTPGRCVQVIQQSPETAVQVENTELALEAGLASKVNVEEVK